MGGEVFCNTALMPSDGLTADLQVIDGFGRFSDTAVAGGLRARISF